MTEDEQFAMTKICDVPDKPQLWDMNNFIQIYAEKSKPSRISDIDKLDMVDAKQFQRFNASQHVRQSLAMWCPAMVYPGEPSGISRGMFSV